jgi:7-cyano-7-deazaguanine synthase in queuosine biosynthesis
VSLPPYTVIVDDCATPGTPNPLSVRTRPIGTNPQNYLVDYAEVTRGLPVPLTSHQQDVLDLLFALYAADLACDRDRQHADVDWAREIHLHVPLRDPDVLLPHAAMVELTFHRLTYDTLHLHLEQATDPPKAPRQAENQLPGADCVALLSGGVDSFAGALVLNDEGQRPHYLIHRNTGTTLTAQRAVTDVLSAKSPDRAALWFRADRTGGRFPGSEMSQRSRTLLYVGVASLVASACDIEDVYVNENGVMAVHAPMTEARVGALSTRTAAPAILDAMGDLFSALYGKRVVVKNRLLHDTKPEVVKRVLDFGHGADLPDTVSCWMVNRPGGHCGACAPCMARRISCEMHGAPDVTYVHDPFGDPAATQDRSRHDNLVHLCQFVCDLVEMGSADIEFAYPEILSGGRQITGSDALAMHTRWGNQAVDVLRRYPVSSRLVS